MICFNSFVEEMEKIALSDELVERARAKSTERLRRLRPDAVRPRTEKRVGGLIIRSSGSLFGTKEEVHAFRNKAGLDEQAGKRARRRAALKATASATTGRSPRSGGGGGGGGAALLAGGALAAGAGAALYHRHRQKQKSGR